MGLLKDSTFINTSIFFFPFFSALNEERVRRDRDLVVKGEEGVEILRLNVNVGGVGGR